MTTLATSADIKSKKRAVVLFSGGLDSTTLLAKALSEGYQTYALSFDYGQRHRSELEAALKLSKSMGALDHKVIKLDLRAIGGSALTDAEIDVPEEGYQKGAVPEGIPVTYVPARNTVFLSIAMGYAEVLEADSIFIGVNAVDYSGYPDCRPEFIASFAETARLGTKQGVEGRPFAIHAPLQDMSKADIARECDRLGLDPAWSWSCYDPTAEGQACGTCDSCRLRRKGFADAGLVDTTPYSEDITQ